LRCIIKTDPELQKIVEIDTPEKRKNYTAVYNNYIQDRDYYTHGILFFFYPAFAPVLRVKSATGEMQYVRYEKKVFTDNLMTHGYLSDILHKVREILQQQIFAKNQTEK